MTYKRLLKNSLSITVIAASIGLTACGGGGSDTPKTETPVVSAVTLSGKVADGYLSGATVCLDLNRNKICDTGEPSAISTAGGNYSLEATQRQIETFPVLVQVIAGTTVDEDNPGAVVTKKYTLSAPAGKGAFVSPLTTMVQTKIETTGASIASIENELLTSIGQDSSGVSLFDDYVDMKTSSASTTDQDNYEKLHQVAQVTATVIANKIATVESALMTADPTGNLDDTIDAIVALVVEEVIAELTAISTEIDAATTFDAITVATAATTPVNETTVVADVAAQETTLTTYYASTESWWGSMVWGTNNWNNQ